MALKRSEHRHDPSDILLGEMEFRLIMGSAWEYLDELTAQVFCTCKADAKRLIDYKPYLVQLDDIVLKGKCSGCGTIAARYIETGENPESVVVAKRIRAMHKSKKVK